VIDDVSDGEATTFEPPNDEVVKEVLDHFDGRK
jgi:hypothetical protein